MRSANTCRARSSELRSSRKELRDDLVVQRGHARARTPAAQRREVVVVTESASEVVVCLRHALLAQLEHGDLEVGRLSSQLGLTVVVREGHRKTLCVAFLQADEVVLEAGDEALASDDQRHAVCRRALDRLAVA